MDDLYACSHLPGCKTDRLQRDGPNYDLLQNTFINCTSYAVKGVHPSSTLMLSVMYVQCIPVQLQQLLIFYPFLNTLFDHQHYQNI